MVNHVAVSRRLVQRIPTSVPSQHVPVKFLQFRRQPFSSFSSDFLSDSRMGDSHRPLRYVDVCGFDWHCCKQTLIMAADLS